MTAFPPNVSDCIDKTANSIRFDANLLNLTAADQIEDTFTSFCLTMFIFSTGIVLNGFYIFHFGTSINRLRSTGNFPWPLFFQFLETITDLIICVLGIMIRLQPKSLLWIYRSSSAVCRIHQSNSIFWAVIAFRGCLCTSTAVYHHSRIQGAILETHTRPVFWSISCLCFSIAPCAVAFYTQFNFYRLVENSEQCQTLYNIPFLTSSQDIALTRLSYAAFLALTFILPSTVSISLYRELISMFENTRLTTKKMAIYELRMSAIFDGLAFFIFGFPSHWCLLDQYVLRLTEMRIDLINWSYLVTASYSLFYPAVSSYFRRLYKMPFFDCLKCHRTR